MYNQKKSDTKFIFSFFFFFTLDLLQIPKDYIKLYLLILVWLLKNPSNLAVCDCGSHVLCCCFGMTYGKHMNESKKGIVVIHCRIYSISVIKFCVIFTEDNFSLLNSIAFSFTEVASLRWTVLFH